MTEKTLGKGGSYKNTVAWLWHAAGVYKAGIAVLVVFQAAFGICGVIFAMLFRNLVDHAVAGEKQGFVRMLLIMAGLELGEMILEFLAGCLSEWTKASLENRLRKKLFSCLLSRDYAAASAVHSGEWLNRLTSDTSVVTGGMMEILPGLSGMLSRLLGALAAIFLLEPAFLLILIPGGLLIFGLTAVLRRRLRRLHTRIQEANGKVLAFLQERLENLMIVRIFSMEEQTGKEAASWMKRHKSARVRRGLFSSFCSSGFGAVAEGGYLAGIIYGGYGILTGTLSYGTFAAVLQLAGQIQGPFARISGMIPRYYAMISSAERLMEAEAFPQDGEDGRFTQAEISGFYEKGFQSFGLRDASFSYQAPREESGKTAVMEHFDLEIRKGEYVAFTGHSGCGKSTLLKLLMCLYPLDGGERYVSGINEEGERVEYPLTAAWRGLFSYVPQGNQLMSGTIREIIAFGDPEAMREEERLEQALKISCADEFVASLENGVDTPLGERGHGLSEGQMQRIAIARALFSGRPVLMLDEATSSLDETTERRLLTNLRQMTDKTVLIITHRPAALGICDREVIMEEAGIRQNGPETETGRKE